MTLVAVMTLTFSLSASAAKGGKKPPKDDDGGTGGATLAVSNFRDCKKLAPDSMWDGLACGAGDDQIQSDGNGDYNGQLSSGNSKGSQYSTGPNHFRTIWLDLDDSALDAGCSSPLPGGLTPTALGDSAGFRIQVDNYGGLWGMTVDEVVPGVFLSVFEVDGNNWFLEFNPEKIKQGCGGTTWLYVKRISAAVGASVWEVTTDDPDNPGMRGWACLHGGEIIRGKEENAGLFEMDFALRIREQ